MGLSCMGAGQLMQQPQWQTRRRGTGGSVAASWPTAQARNDGSQVMRRSALAAALRWYAGALGKARRGVGVCASRRQAPCAPPARRRGRSRSAKAPRRECCVWESGRIAALSRGHCFAFTSRGRAIDGTGAGRQTMRSYVRRRRTPEASDRIALVPSRGGSAAEQSRMARMARCRMPDVRLELLGCVSAEW